MSGNVNAARAPLRLVRTATRRPSYSRPVCRNLADRRLRYDRQHQGLRSPPVAKARLLANASSRPSNALPVQRANRRYVSDGKKQAQETPDQPPGRNTQLATTLAESDSSDLVSEVHIPFDPNGVLPSGHPARAILGNSSLVIQRQLEIMNVIAGFEQANRYILMDGKGETLGYIAEQDHGFGQAIKRQMFKTHRSFTTHIFDRQEREVLRIHRPFAYINSRIRIYDPVPEGGFQELPATSSTTAVLPQAAGDHIGQAGAAQVSPLKLEEMRIIGEAQQQWSPLRRKYNLFSYRPLTPAPSEGSTPRLESGQRPATDSKALTEARVPDVAIEAGMSQFAHVNEPFLSWDFTLRNEGQETIGSVNRNFGGFAREIFTDTGVYALRMDSAAQTSSLENTDGTEVARYERDATAMTLDQRAVMLATAVSIDFDYFSRHSGGGMPIPFFWPMGGTAAEGGAAGAGAGAAGAGAGAAAGEAGAIGAAEGVGAGAVGAAGRGIGSAAGAGEGAVAGAGTIAGVEAMRGYGSRGGPADDASPTSEPFPGATSDSQSGAPGPEQMDNQPGGNDVWGENSDPWGRGGPGDGPPSSGGDGGGDGGGSWTDVISDFFNS